MSKKNNEYPTRTGASGGTSERPASGFGDAMAIYEKGVMDALVKEQNEVMAAALPMQEPPTPAAPAAPVVVKRPEATNVIQLSPTPSALQLLAGDIDITEKRANVDLDVIPANTRPAHAAAKREAQDKLESLKERYWNALRPGLVAIFLDGDHGKQREFVEAATKSSPAPVLFAQADALYYDLAFFCQPTRHDNSFEPGDYARFLTAIKKSCMDIDFKPAPQPEYVPTILNGPLEAKDYVRERIRSVCGDALVLYSIQKQIARGAWEIRYEDSVVPVIVTGATREEIDSLSQGLFGGRGIVWKISGDVSDETVTKAMKALKNKLKKST